MCEILFHFHWLFDGPGNTEEQEGGIYLNFLSSHLTLFCDEPMEPTLSGFFSLTSEKLQPARDWVKAESALADMRATTPVEIETSLYLQLPPYMKGECRAKKYSICCMYFSSRDVFDRQSS